MYPLYGQKPAQRGAAFQKIYEGSRLVSLAAINPSELGFDENYSTGYLGKIMI